MRAEPASFAQTGIGAVHPGLGFAPCWGELLFLGQKANVVSRRRRKAPLLLWRRIRYANPVPAVLVQKRGLRNSPRFARLRQVLALIRFWPARGGARKVAEKAELMIQRTCHSIDLHRCSGPAGVNPFSETGPWMAPQQGLCRRCRSAQGVSESRACLFERSEFHARRYGRALQGIFCTGTCKKHRRDKPWFWLLFPKEK